MLVMLGIASASLHVIMVCRLLLFNNLWKQSEILLR